MSKLLVQDVTKTVTVTQEIEDHDHGPQMYPLSSGIYALIHEIKPLHFFTGPTCTPASVDFLLVRFKKTKQQKNKN